MCPLVRKRQSSGSIPLGPVRPAVEGCLDNSPNLLSAKGITPVFHPRFVFFGLVTSPSFWKVTGVWTGTVDRTTVGTSE